MNFELFGRLRHHHLLATLDDEQFARIGLASQLVLLEPGQMLFQRGSPASAFFLVLEGQLKLCLQSRNGDEKIISRVHPGEACAEALLFSESPAYPVVGIAEQRSRVAAVPNLEYKQILESSTPTCFRLLADLSLKLHTHLREIESLSFENARNRLADYLLDLAMRHPGEHSLRLTESKQGLAARLGIKPETLSRTLRVLADAGAIQVSGREIQLLDRSKLRAPLP